MVYCTHKSQVRGTGHALGGLLGRHGKWSEGRAWAWGPWAEVFTVGSVGRNRRGRASNLGIDCCAHLCRLWTIRTDLRLAGQGVWEPRDGAVGGGLACI